MQEERIMKKILGKELSEILEAMILKVFASFSVLFYLGGGMYPSPRESATV